MDALEECGPVVHAVSTKRRHSLLLRLATLMKLLVHIHPDDNVAVAPQAIAAGTRDGALDFADIPAGHKAALRPIHAGEPVIKYGFPIGLATAEIAPGEHVHVHNVRTGLAEDTELKYEGSRSSLPLASEVPTFMGYRRPDGRAATRNEIWIVNTVACVNVPSQRIADLAAREFVTPGGAIDGIHAFTHP